MPVTEKVKRAGRNEMNKGDRIKLHKLMLAYLAEVKAVPTPGQMYDYELETPHGKLLISFETADTIYPSVHCRFEDVDRACKKFNPDKRLQGEINPFSGKYNTLVSGKWSGQMAFETFFKPHLERALKE